MPEHDKEPKEIREHAHPHEMPPCPCRHGRPLGWIIATVILGALLLLSACFNVYFITSREADSQRRATIKSREINPESGSRKRERAQDHETKKQQKSDTSTEQQQ